MTANNIAITKMSKHINNMLTVTRLFQN